MFTDKRKTVLLSALIFVLLCLVFFIPNGSSRIYAAILLLAGGIACFILLKKRAVYSIDRGQVIMLMTFAGLLYLTLYYLSELKFGFYWAYNAFSAKTLTEYIYPIVCIIIGGEFIRKFVLAQESRWANVFAYLIGVFSEALIFAGIKNIHTFNQFMDLFALYFFPAIISNLLYNYLAKRYGILPNVLYRLPFTLVPYLLAVRPALPDALFSFAKLFVPLLIYWFVTLLYEKKRKYAVKRKRRWAYIFAILPVAVLAAYVMLISCQFTYGMLVIGSERMTGEINKGDALIYEEYDGQKIDIGEVIVFNKNGSKVVHRVVDVEYINGENRYTTKGDLNEEEDSGFITESQIIGVANFKIPYLGYPTLWLREWFHR